MAEAQGRVYLMERLAIRIRNTGPILHKQIYCDISYNDAFRRLQISQIAAAILAIYYMANTSEYIEVFNKKSESMTISFLLFELIMWSFVVSILGCSRIPANYIPMFIIRSFIFFEDHKSYHHHLQLTYCSEKLADEPLIYLANLFVALPLAIAVLWWKMRVGGCEVGSLIGNTIGTISSGFILVSSIKMRNNLSSWILHFRLCVLWVHFAAILSFFNLTFLFQRFYFFLQGRISKDKFQKTILEILIWSISAYVTVLYLMEIHSNFTPQEIFAFSSIDVICELIPKEIQEYFGCGTLDLIEKKNCQMYKINLVRKNCNTKV